MVSQREMEVNTRSEGFRTKEEKKELFFQWLREERHITILIDDSIEEKKKG